MRHFLSRWIIWGNYSKWIVILHELYLEFVAMKSNKLLVFVEMLSNIPPISDGKVVIDSFPDEYFFLIRPSNVWYGDI